MIRLSQTRSPAIRQRVPDHQRFRHNRRRTAGRDELPGRLHEDRDSARPIDPIRCDERDLPGLQRSIVYLRAELDAMGPTRDHIGQHVQFDRRIRGRRPRLERQCGVGPTLEGPEGAGTLKRLER